MRRKKTDRLIDRLASFIIYHPKTILLFLLLLTLGFMYSLSHIEEDQSMDKYFRSNDDDYAFREIFKKQFNSDEFFLIAFETQNVFSTEVLTTIDRITAKLEAIEEVREVVSLTNVEDIIGRDLDFIVDELIDDVPDNSVALDSIKQAALSNPLYVNNLISQNGKATAIVVRTYEQLDDDLYRKRLMNKVEKLLEQEPGYKYHLSGTTVINFQLANYMNRDLVTFFPICMLIMAVIIFFVFRSVLLTLVAMLNIGICVLWSQGIFWPLGATMNATTSIVPPLVVSLATAVVIHIYTWYQNKVTSELEKIPAVSKQGRNVITPARKKELLASTWREIFKPTLLTALTTAIGFGSLIISRVAPIRHFGKVAPFGMLFCFLISMTLIPALLTFISPPFRAARKSNFLKKILDALCQFTVKAAKPILTVASVVLALAVWSASHVIVETDSTEMFGHKTPVYKAFQFIDKHLAGTGTIEISVRGKDAESILEPVNLETVEKLANYLKQKEKVDKVTSVNDYLKEMNKSFYDENPEYYRLPETKNKAAQFMLLYSGDEIEEYIDEQYVWIRISARTSAHSSKDMQELINDTRVYIKTTLADSDLDFRITGRSLLETKMLRDLVNGQVQSMALAIVLIFGLMFLIFKSFSLGITSFIPNLFPIIANLGVMGLLDIPLNAATAVISAVAIGIAVDDTIHFLYHYKLEKQRTASTHEAIAHTIHAKGSAIIFTTIVISVGFSVMSTSNFGPIRDFGILTALTMVNALIGDMIILPAFLAVFKPVKPGAVK